MVTVTSETGDGHLVRALRRGAGPIPPCSTTIRSTPETLQEKLIKIGAKVVGHSRYIAFQMAEVAIPRNVFANILRMIVELRPPPITSTA
jgi:hypothetical protein